MTGDFNSDGTETAETKTVTAIASDTSLTVDSAFSGNITASATLGTRYAYLAFLGPSDIVNNHNYTSTTQATQLGGNLLLPRESMNQMTSVVSRFLIRALSMPILTIMLQSQPVTPLILLPRQACPMRPWLLMYPE